MKEILLGWLIKPEIMQTPIDKLIGATEFIILIVIVITIISIYLTIKENKEEKKKWQK